MENERSFLEVRVPKDSEETPEASSAFFVGFLQLQNSFSAVFFEREKGN